ncbi:MAG TPA: FAD-dependent monooxygenase, partial [Polyangiaceae bacterium]
MLEAYPRTEDVGGAFQIAPNGLRVLAELGLADTLLVQGQPCSDMAFRNHRGRLIGVVRTARAGHGVNILRAAVHRALRDEAQRRGIDVRYGKRLASVAQAGREAVAARVARSRGRHALRPARVGRLGTHRGRDDSLRV